MRSAALEIQSVSTQGRSQRVARVVKATANPLTSVFNPGYVCVSTLSLVIYSKQQP